MRNCGGGSGRSPPNKEMNEVSAALVRLETKSATTRTQLGPWKRTDINRPALKSDRVRKSDLAIVGNCLRNQAKLSNILWVSTSMPTQIPAKFWTKFFKPARFS